MTPRVRNRRLLREIRREKRLERNGWWVCLAVPPAPKHVHTKRQLKKFLKYFKDRTPTRAMMDAELAATAVWLRGL